MLEWKKEKGRRKDKGTNPQKRNLSRKQGYVGKRNKGKANSA